jgi:hypothetical protein
MVGYGKGFGGNIEIGTAATAMGIEFAMNASAVVATEGEGAAYKNIP